MAQILVIDDDPVLRLILKRTLEAQGHSVTVVDNGVAGVEQAHQLQPALIICDWMMPKMDGLEVCRQVRSNPDLSGTLLVLLTARDHIADRIKGLDAGADDFLTKPIDMTELKARVRAALRLYQLNQDLRLQKQQIETELAEAAAYVRSLLPSSMQEYGVTIDSRFIPSLKLGGDCFDYYWLDPDYLLFYLCDVSGHGLGAALPSISVLNTLRTQMLPGVNFYRPESVLEGLNENFQMTDHHEKYFTIWYGVYNRRKRQLTYSSAGHPPAILISSATDGSVTVQRLRVPSLPIGMLPETIFNCDRCDVPPNSVLYVFSDGIYELVDTDQKVYWTLDEFIELLASQHHAPLDRILNQVKAICRTETFNDDLSILSLDLG